MTRTHTHWAHIPEVGSGLGIRLLVLLYSLVGVAIVRLVMYPVVAYFFLSKRPARDASLEYLTQVKSFDPAVAMTPSQRTSFRHFMAFADSLVDRFGAWMGRIRLDELGLSGHDELIATLDRGTGVVLIGAHLGSLEISRALSRFRPHLKLNVVMHTLNAARFNRILERVSRDNPVELIEASTFGPALAARLQRKIANGELIAIMGDRIPVASERVIATEFLGRTANFPQGPIILAALLKCPVFTIFCVKANGRYRLICERFADRIKFERSDRDGSIRRYVERFARTLERYCCAYPLQWFNFYPFWG